MTSSWRRRGWPWAPVARVARRAGRFLAPRSRRVSLVAVDEAVLTRLVGAALSGAQPDEVTPPLPPGDRWGPERIEWLRRFHRDRRLGLEGPLGEATWAVAGRLRRSAVGPLLRLQRQPGERRPGCGRPSTPSRARRARIGGHGSAPAATRSSPEGDGCPRRGRPRCRSRGTGPGAAGTSAWLEQPAQVVLARRWARGRPRTRSNRRGSSGRTRCGPQAGEVQRAGQAGRRGEPLRLPQRPLERAVAAHRQAGDEGVLPPLGHRNHERDQLGQLLGQERPVAAAVVPRRRRSCGAPAASRRPARAARRTARSTCGAARWCRRRSGRAAGRAPAAGRRWPRRPCRSASWCAGGAAPSSTWTAPGRRRRSRRGGGPRRRSCPVGTAPPRLAMVSRVSRPEPDDAERERALGASVARSAQAEPRWSRAACSGWPPCPGRFVATTRPAARRRGSPCRARRSRVAESAAQSPTGRQHAAQRGAGGRNDESPRSVDAWGSCWWAILGSNQ